MFTKIGVPFITLGAALILNLSPVMAQTRSGGNWSGRNGNNTAQPSYPLSGSQAQQQYSPNVHSQQRGYSNADQGQQGPAGSSNSRGNFSAPQQQYTPNTGWQERSYSNSYRQGQAYSNSYAVPDYRSYERPYRESYESHRWRERLRERMWRERSRRHGWDW